MTTLSCLVCKKPSIPSKIVNYAYAFHNLAEVWMLAMLPQELNLVNIF